MFYFMLGKMSLLSMVSFVNAFSFSLFLKQKTLINNSKHLQALSSLCHVKILFQMLQIEYLNNVL